MNFHDLSSHLSTLTDGARRCLGAMSSSDWEHPYPGSSSWTRGELLGHLIDSAVNNQQRFARALIEDELHN